MIMTMDWRTVYYVFYIAHVWTEDGDEFVNIVQVP